MEKEKFLAQVGEFTWMWGQEFHIQVGERAFVWLSPSYGGDNTIRPYPLSAEELCEKHKDDDVPWGRDKGIHVLSDYVGNDVTLIDC